MTQHVPPPQGRRIIVCEIGGLTRPESRSHPGTRLMSRDELAMLMFRRDLYRKKLQHRYDIKLFREQFHRDMAAFEAQLAVLRREEERKAAKNNHWQDQPRRSKGTEGAGQFAASGDGTPRRTAVLDAGTVYARPPEGEGGKGGDGEADAAESTTTADVAPPSDQIAMNIGDGSSLSDSDLWALVSQFVNAAEPEAASRRNSAGLLGRALGKVLAAWQRQSRSPTASPKLPQRPPGAKTTSDVIAPDGQIPGRFIKDPEKGILWVSQQEFDTLVEQLMIGAVEISPPSSYKEGGKYYQRFDGVQFGRRQAGSGDTIDFYSKQNGVQRFHIYKGRR